MTAIVENQSVIETGNGSADCAEYVRLPFGNTTAETIPTAGRTNHHSSRIQAARVLLVGAIRQSRAPLTRYVATIARASAPSPQ